MTSHSPATAAGSSGTGDLRVPTGADAAWAGLGGFGGMLVGLLVGAVPLVVLREADLVALLLVGTALGGALGLWLTVVRRRGWSPAELGFRRGRRSSWHLLWQVPVALVAGLAGTVALGTALGVAPDAAGQQDSVTDSLTAAPWAVVVGAACVVLLVPALEEVVFRRFLLGWLRTRLPLPVAVLLSAGVFGLVHLAPAVALYAFFLGVSTALLHVWHRNLWAPLALHAVNNALASLVAVLALT